MEYANPEIATLNLPLWTMPPTAEEKAKEAKIRRWFNTVKRARYVRNRFIGGLFALIKCECGAEGVKGICSYDWELYEIETVCYCCEECRDAHYQDT